MRRYTQGGCKERRCDKAKTPSDKVGRCTLKPIESCFKRT